MRHTHTHTLVRLYVCVCVKKKQIKYLKLIEAQNELSPSTRVLVTVHPSYLLRVLPESRDAEYAQFVQDLNIAAKYIRNSRS